jgi:hypothetical protein
VQLPFFTSRNLRIDKYRAFFNGTVAVYLDGIFVKYEVKPPGFFGENKGEASVEETLVDRNISTFRNTVKTFDPPANQTDRIYRDCLNNKNLYWNKNRSNLMTIDSFGIRDLI